VTRREPLDVTVGSRRAQVRSAKYTVKSAFRAHGELQLLAKKKSKNSLVAYVSNGQFSQSGLLDSNHVLPSTNIVINGCRVPKLILQR